MTRVSTCGKCRGAVYLVDGRFEHTCYATTAPAAEPTTPPRAAQTPPSPVRFTVTGAPRTKKNHGRNVPATSKRGTPYAKHLPSKAWKEWRKDARVVPHPGLLPARDYNVTALFYRDANRGDAVGFYQGLADLLEDAGVVENDRMFTQWDGSRLLKDAARPRVEVTLTPVAEAT